MRGYHPTRIEGRYRRKLWRRLDVQRRLLHEVLTARADALDPADALRLLNGVRAVRQVFEVDLPPDVGGLARSVDTFATSQSTRLVEQIVGVKLSRPRDLEPLRRAWERDNAALIADLDRQLFDDVAEALREGRTDLVATLQARHKVARSRAALIADNEVGTLNSRISQHRMQEAGVDRYEWSTSDDERVRPEHARLDGTIRRWDDPHPTEGHPGEAIRCRCVALPVA